MGRQAIPRAIYQVYKQWRSLHEYREDSVLENESVGFVETYTQAYTFLSVKKSIRD